VNETTRTNLIALVAALLVAGLILVLFMTGMMGARRGGLDRTAV
jgi:hypothetical protein